jgi:hypothetical protein
MRSGWRVGRLLSTLDVIVGHGPSHFQAKKAQRVEVSVGDYRTRFGASSQAMGVARAGARVGDLTEPEEEPFAS